MSDITNVLPGGFTGVVNKVVAPPEDQLRQAMSDAGLELPDEIFLDGQIHRFRSGTKGKGGIDKSGWYVAFGDGVPAGRFGCWREGMEQSWTANIGRELSVMENMANSRRMSEAKAARDLAKDKAHEVTAETVSKIWSDCTGASPDHPYLKAKNIHTNGSRVTGDGRLVVPLYGADGKLSSLQYIGIDGTKLYHKGGAISGRSWLVGDIGSSDTLYIAEGFATAASIHEVTGHPCIVSYSASNLVPVSQEMREKYGVSKDIVIVADNDVSGTGVKFAEKACEKSGARYILIPSIGDANDYVQEGGDLSELLSVKEVDDWLVSAGDFCSQPAPINWKVKHWVQSDALIMVHGESGSGKTFFVLDLCLRMSSGIEEWAGNRVSKGRVIYLAGEGHHGLKGRITAWAQHNKVDTNSIDMMISQSGTDLNTPAGLQKVISSIDSADLIVVDTLHRFLDGDENKAVDVKTMLDACSSLMDTFGCTVILVHHVGNGDKDRARGSSSWKGALDIEINVAPGANDGPTMISQKKNKDAEEAEPVFMELQGVNILGWIDEDGEQATSAVPVIVDGVVADERETKLDRQASLFSRAWMSSGCEDIDGKPYVSSSALQEFFVSNMGKSESTAKNYSMPSYKNGTVGQLIEADIIGINLHGFVMLDKVLASKMMIMKNSK